MPDRITALSFDNAVMTYGIHVENKLQERWANGEPMYSLFDILHGHEEWYVRQKNQATLDAILGKPE